MPYNSSYSYSPATPEFPAKAGTVIRAADFNTIINDIATALTKIGVDVTTDGPAIIEYMDQTLESKLTEHLSIKDYGATGLAAEDASSEMLDALTELFSNTEGSLYLPAGVYTLDTLVSVTVPTTGSYTIYGDGPSTIIQVNNSSGGIKLESSGRHCYICIRDFNLAPALADSGIGFEYTVPEGGVSQRRVCEVRNITIEPADSLDTTSDFTTPLKINGVNRPIVDNCAIWKQTDLASDAILNLDYCYAPIVHNCYVNGAATYGITNVRTDNNEGLFIFDSTINGADTCVYSNQTGRHPQIYISRCHLNGFVANIHLVNCKYIWIDNNLLYTQAITGESFDDIILDDCDSAYISQGIYRTGTGEASDRRHVKLINGTQFVTIDDKGLNGQTTLAPYYICATCANVEIALPNTVPDYDFASYPATAPLDLIECLSASVLARTPSSIGWWSNTNIHGPDFDLRRYSASPAAGDTIGSFRVFAQNTAGEMVLLGSIAGRLVDPTDGSEDGQFYIYGVSGGTPVLDLVAGAGVSIGNDDVQGQGTVNIKGKDSLAIRLNNGMGIYFGDASPESSVTASPGSLYMRSNGTIYKKASGTGNTGWSALT